MRITKFLTSCLLGAAFVMASAVSAAASDCIEIDKANDTLTSQEQKAAINTFKAVLEKQNFDALNCQTFTLTHSRLGDVVTINVVYGPETRTLRASSLSDLPAAYDQIVLSLVSNQPLEDAIRRDNVTKTQATREKESIDSLMSFGFSGTGSSKVERLMPGFHLAWQFQTDAHAFGFNAGLTVGAGAENDNESANEGYARGSFGLDYSYFLSPMTPSSLYVGSGIGYEADAVGSMTGDGFYLSPAVGMEFFRTSAARVGVELRGTLPLYQISDDNDSAQWNPSLALVLSIGWEVAPEWLVFSLLSR